MPLQALNTKILNTLVLLFLRGASTDSKGNNKNVGGLQPDWWDFNTHERGVSPNKLDEKGGFVTRFVGFPIPPFMRG